MKFEQKAQPSFSELRFFTFAAHRTTTVTQRFFLFF
jgi:hypothetical protein